MAKKMGKKIYFEIDDDLFHVPADNSTTHTYNHPDIQRATKKCIQLADEMSVTTQELKRLYAPYCKNVTVIPNAWDERFCPEWKKMGNSNIIAWRGSNSHQNDLLSHKAGLKKAYDSTSPGKKWFFYGDDPWFLKDALPNKVFRGGVHFADWYRFLGNDNPDIGVVPLHNNVFNKSKSMIAWMELSMAGAAVVCPDFEEWQRPGATNYADVDDFSNKIIELASDRDLVKKNREQSVEYIKQELNLNKINQQRIALIKKMKETKY
jgi:hypothetical protein